MAEFRNDRLLCKHFNLSYLEVRDDLSQAEYICLLAEALDAEELDDYNTAVLIAKGFHDIKGIKRWKWASIDKAGTSPMSYNTDPGASIANVAMAFGGGKVQASGNYLSYVRATGRPLAFRTNEGKLIDEDGQEVEQTKDMVIVPYLKQEM